MKKLPAVLLTLLTVLILSTSCESGGSAGLHTVSFRTGIEKTIPMQTVKDGSTATAPDTSSFTKEGFGFDGWTLDGDLYDFSTPVTKDIVLVAKWGVKCTVAFYDSDGETTLGIEAQIIDFYSKATEPETPVKPGYTFVRWTERDGAPYSFSRPVYDTSLDLIAVWDANEYTLTYDANGADNSSVLPSSSLYTYGESFSAADISSTTSFSKTGCVFEGWTLTEDGSGTVYKCGDKVEGLPNDMTLYAKWTDPGYKTGDLGPTGGIIIAVNDGTYSGDWKYIEASPDCLEKYYPFGYYRYEVQTNIAVGTTATDIGKGRDNTDEIVEKMGNKAAIEESSHSETLDGGVTHVFNIWGEYAALACENYVYGKDGVSYDDWYLPSEKEMLDGFYDSFNAPNKREGVTTGIYATSTELSATTINAVVFYSDEVYPIRKARVEERAKSANCSVWPVRYI